LDLRIKLRFIGDGTIAAAVEQGGPAVADGRLRIKGNDTAAAEADRNGGVNGRDAGKHQRQGTEE
jgi:hypothetical protein